MLSETLFCWMREGTARLLQTSAIYTALNYIIIVEGYALSTLELFRLTAFSSLIYAFDAWDLPWSKDCVTVFIGHTGQPCAILDEMEKK